MRSARMTVRIKASVMVSTASSSSPFSSVCGGVAASGFTSATIVGGARRSRSASCCTGAASRPKSSDPSGVRMADTASRTTASSPVSSCASVAPRCRRLESQGLNLKIRIGRASSFGLGYGGSLAVSFRNDLLLCAEPRLRASCSSTRSLSDEFWEREEVERRKDVECKMAKDYGLSIPLIDTDRVECSKERAHQPRRMALFVEPSPFAFICGYCNRFQNFTRFLQEMGDEVWTVTRRKEVSPEFYGGKICLQSQGAAEELWGDRSRKSLFMNTPAPFSQHQAAKLAVEVCLSSDNHNEEGMNREMISRRSWLLLSGFLAGILSVPTKANSLSRTSDLADNNGATDGSLSSNASGDTFGPTESQQQSAAVVKSWYRYRGEGFVIRVPPGYEDVLEPEDDLDDDDALYGKRAKDKPFAARFASPDRIEVLSIIIKPASQLRLSFLETKDITDFGSIKDAAPNFVPPGSKLVSARIVNSKASRIPRTYYMYEFLVKGMHFMVSAGVSKGNVFVLGASTPQSKWKDHGSILQLASSTFYLP